MTKRTYYNGEFIQRSRDLYTVTEGLPSDDILALAYDKNGVLYAGTAKGPARLENGVFAPVKLPGEAAAATQMLFTDAQGTLWAGAGSTLFTLTGKKAAAVQGFGEPIAAMAQGEDGRLWLATEDNLYLRENSRSDFTFYLDIPGTATSLAVNGSRNVYAGTERSGLLAISGKRQHWSELLAQFCPIPDNRVLSVAFDSVGYLWVGTGAGLCVYDGKSNWLGADKVPGLPQGVVTAMAFAENGERWFATTTGLVLLKDGALKYLGYKRWVPHPGVKAVAVRGGETAAATAKGLSVIKSQTMTLEKKAAHYTELTEKYHTRKDGFVTIRFLDKEGDLTSGMVEISDNDGTWTAFYMASQAYRYGATGDKNALKIAKKGLGALKKLAYVTGIVGFTARAVRYADEPGFGDGDEEWHLSAEGDCEWKGETSSDEMVGNYYGYSVYYDIAADEKEKLEIAAMARATTDHIIHNNYRLVDFDGLPTTWACWAPESLNHDNRWVFEKGQNALEILSILKTTYHMTGDEKYQNEYLRLIKEHHYLMNVMHYKIEDFHLCHIDDELAMMIITPLLKYEKDPVIRSYILMGLERHWQYERPERTPLWSIVYGALTGKHCDIELAAQALEQLPLDLIHWQTYNSHRKDLEWEQSPAFFCSGPQLKQALPFDEKPISKYDSNPMHADSGCEEIYEEFAATLPDGKTPAPERGGPAGKRAEDGTVYLHPYWMARYYGLLGD
ncbi:MAG TPA: two-component regulator propeller domain-containing protein [Clostridiales bacterium]|nr:two-component regulator propeller domain-containing protein [Clostridiales bacterium]